MKAGVQHPSCLLLENRLYMKEKNLSILCSNMDILISGQEVWYFGIKGKFPLVLWYEILENLMTSICEGI